jgi:hypothetical protein
VQPRRLTYADAVRLLAGHDSEVVEWLGRAAGVPAAAATIASLGTVDFFALRGALVEWGHAAVSGLRERPGCGGSTAPNGWSRRTPCWS